MDLKKESIVRWCCHFKLATNILLSFSNMPYNFIRFAGVKSNELSIKNVANSWACCWASVSFTISGGLSSTSKGFTVLAVRSKLAGSILCPKAYQPALRCNIQPQWCLHLPLPHTLQMASHLIQLQFSGTINFWN
jgi:hypothetical protein